MPANELTATHSGLSPHRLRFPRFESLAETVRPSIKRKAVMRALQLFVAASTMIAVSASAAAIRPFDPQAFEALQVHNAPAIIFVHAPWCPICRAQEQTIKTVLATPKYKDVTVLTIDFDSQKALWKKFGARQQSTLIGFHGRRETARLAYNADPVKVTAVIASSLR